MARLEGFEDRPTEFLFDVDLMGRMDDAGLFAAESARIELRQGKLIKMAPVGVEHGLSTPKVSFELWRVIRTISDHSLAVVQGTVTLGSMEAPIPDAAVVAGRPQGRYFEAAQVLLIVEVSKSTLREDLTTKRDVYARAGIAEYWVVDPVGRITHCFRGPVDGLYGHYTRLSPPDFVSPLFANGAADIAVADLF